MLAITSAKICGQPGNLFFFFALGYQSLSLIIISLLIYIIHSHFHRKYNSLDDHKIQISHNILAIVLSNLQMSVDPCND